MKVIKNNSGFTLIELLVTIAIIAVAIGFTSFGISIVSETRTKGAAKDFETDLKMIRMNSITYTDKQYYIRWNYDTVNGYSYDIIDTAADSSAPPMQTVKISKQINIDIVYPLEVSQSLSTLIGAAPSKAVIRFDTNGKVIPYKDDASIQLGGGIYTFKNNDTTTQGFVVTITQVTGGIFYDEK